MIISPDNKFLLTLMVAFIAFFIGLTQIPAIYITWGKINNIEGQLKNARVAELWETIAKLEGHVKFVEGKTDEVSQIGFGVTYEKVTWLEQQVFDIQTALGMKQFSEEVLKGFSEEQTDNEKGE